MNTTFYSLMPCLNTEVGHIYEYNRSLAKAVQLNGWHHVGIIPKRCSILSIPKHWLKILTQDEWDTNKKFLFRIIASLKNIPPFLRLFNRIKKNKKNSSVLFIEHGLHHLLGCTIAILIANPKIELWILHRYDYLGQRSRGKIYHCIHKILQWKLGRDHVKLLTDSALLAKTQSNMFKAKIHLVPIPHTSLAPMKKDNPAKLLLWWPGGSIREDKGLKYIQKLAYDLNPQFQLILASKAKPLFNKHIKHISFIETTLTRKEYNIWMRRVDFVLLPYLPSVYHSSTSGIFVEAIVSGTIPLTIAGTWMAHELKTHHLSELILDWKQSIVSHLEPIKKNDDIQQKFQNMQQCYLAFHSLKGFAKSMKHIISC